MSEDSNIRTVRTNLRPRAFSHCRTNPTREQIRAYIQVCFGESLPSLDVNRAAEKAFTHFTGLPLFGADVPDIYYEVAEEL